MSHIRLISIFIALSLSSAAYASSQNNPNLRKIRVGKEAAQILEKRFGWEKKPAPEGTFDYILTEEQVNQLGQALHEERGRCGGFKDVTFGDFKAPSKVFSAPKRKLSFAGPDLGPVNEISEENIRKTVEKLSSYPTRRYSTDTGKQAAEWVKTRIEDMAREYGRKDVTVELVDHSGQRSGWKMPSVIAKISGTDLESESVIIGGHLDSINWKFLGGTKAPGADDDASGVATALEAFRVVMASGKKPHRTIEFMAYSGEEVGLWGSQEIAKGYRNANKNVKAVMQFDMVMYPEPDGSLFLINDNVDPNLTQYVRGLGEQLGLKMVLTKCGYACSDHASWTSAGYPSVFPFESAMEHYNPKIHSSGDTMENAPAVDHAVKFGKIGVAFLWDLAVNPDVSHISFVNN